MTSEKESGQNDQPPSSGLENVSSGTATSSGEGPSAGGVILLAGNMVVDREDPN